MNILILNGSPAGKDSITLFTMLYIQKKFPEHHYEVLHVGQKIRAMEKDPDAWHEALEKADLIVFCYPVYTFLAPAQLHRFIELIKESGIDLSGKYATQVTTSKHFYDVTAHQYIRDNCGDLGLRYVRGLSADMEDLTQAKGQREALAFFRYVLWNMERGYFEPVPARVPVRGGERTAAGAEKLSVPAPGRVVIVADFSNAKDGRLREMCERLRNRLPCETEIADIGEFPFAGGCLGCFRCAADGQCVYKDGFADYLRNNIQSADGLVYAYTIRDHGMGYRFKLFDDRQFCNGHRTVTMGKPVGYLVDGCLDAEPNLTMLMEARAQVGGNTLAGIACNQREPDRAVDRLAETLCYAITENYQPPKNFYGVGGLKIFRDLIWQMQGLMRADHRFYKAHGFYDFPQKKRLNMLAMYLPGAMMNSPKLRKKMGGKITEGMIGPYKKVLEKDPGPQETERPSGK